MRMRLPYAFSGMSISSLLVRRTSRSRTVDGPIALPGLFLRFVGVAEVAGALGLLLPGIFRVAKGLTPIAAVGLACIMSGAVVITAMSGPVAAAAIPFVVLLLVALIAHGRSTWAPALA